MQDPQPATAPPSAASAAHDADGAHAADRVDGAAGMGPAAGARSASEWFQLLYHELRRRARGELFRHQALTLGATTLLHEAWMQLDGRQLVFASQAELVAYTGRVMRGIVIDHVRARQADKRGGGAEHLPYETLVDLGSMRDSELLGLDDAMETLAGVDRPLAELVELKFFAGLSFVEIAALRGVSERTVQRDWEKARLFLFSALRG
jgi:RNA polymerase sigma factor (TIGR02999 family)